MAKLKKPPSQRPSHRSNRDSRPMADPNNPAFVAVHEAGHSVAAIVLGIHLESVNIHRKILVDGRQSLGYTNIQAVSYGDVVGVGRERALPLVVQLLAGGSAEARVNPSGLEHGPGGGCELDDDIARRTALLSLCNVERGRQQGEISKEEWNRRIPAANELIIQAINEADILVERHWGAILAVSKELLMRRSLTGAEVAAIVAGNPPEVEHLGC